MEIKATYRIFQLVLITILFFTCKNGPGTVPQLYIDRVSEMPQHPEPYRQLKWREKAVNFDKYAFDFSQQGEYMPLIWLDSSGRNVDQVTFGLYTVIGDVRQGYSSHVEFHESLTSLGAILSAGLSGIDKTKQDGFNYVKMTQNYFNRDTGWNIIMNNTNPAVAMLGGGYGRDWWYDVYPNVLYYGVSYLFQDVEGADLILRTIADQFYKADSVLAGDYHYSYFNYATMTGMKNNIPFQEDAAGGHAYVLLSAYEKFGDKKYLEGAMSALDALIAQKESRFYEVLLPFGAYVAGRLNAEYGTHYDVLKLLNWTFDGCMAPKGRNGWGVITQKWGDYDVYGLQGSITDQGGFAFLMNTHSMAWPLVPLVRYEPRFAETIGKWMLNVSNASRLFYPYEVGDAHQWLPEKKEITRNVIAYEGLRKTDTYKKESLIGVEPVALGDGPLWVEGQPDVSMFSLYSSAYAGIFGAIISETNVDQVLRLNCLATDFYRQGAYPTYLYYNPFEGSSEIVFKNDENQTVDLFDALRHTVVARGVKDFGKFHLSAESAALIVAIPHKAEIKKIDEKYWCNGKVIAFY